MSTRQRTTENDEDQTRGQRTHNGSQQRPIRRQQLGRHEIGTTPDGRRDDSDQRIAKRRRENHTCSQYFDIEQYDIEIVGGVLRFVKQFDVESFLEDR